MKYALQPATVFGDEGDEKPVAALGLGSSQFSKV
jgi:hypothetical protein